MSTRGIIETARRRRSLPEPALRRLIRRRAGLTQEELARELGVDRAALSRWESGQRHPRLANLDRYAALLDRLQREMLR